MKLIKESIILIITIAIITSCNNNTEQNKNDQDKKNNIDAPPPPPPPDEVVYVPYKIDSMIDKNGICIYKNFNVAPSFPGGEAAYNKYIEKNIKIPPEQEDFLSVVMVSFVVLSTGKITDAVVLRSVGPKCDQEAIRLIKMMPKWIPAQVGNKNVNAKYCIPVRFKRPSKNQTIDLK